MRRLIAIITIAAVLGGVVPLGELAKLPHLIAHYLEHAQEGTSFGDYLALHYTHTPTSHQDPHHDKGCLPFQGVERTMTPSTLGAMDRPDEGTAIAASFDEPVTRFALSAEEDLPSTTLGSVFQPPRMG